MSKLFRLSSPRVETGGALEDPFASTCTDPSVVSEHDLLSSLPEAIRPTARGLESPAFREDPEIREELMLDQLDRRDRLRLVEFVCSFAWADFEIHPKERVFIAKLIRRLELDEEEDLRVQQWLDRPPSLEGLDPTSIPSAHRRFFVEAIEGLIAADGEVSDEERESFDVFKQLLVD